ncbi:MAG TPA: carbonic anhydrase [Candidatus Cybelea sp.]|nr:carbonic anhydrase [Candidatus Cybelea sp.]
MTVESATAALALLEAGNARFAAGIPEIGRLDASRLELAGGQSPYAVVLGCSDSRVPIETIFDQTPGKLFVVRVAGNYLTDDVFGSVEFGVAILKARLILVLGHTNCGAVTAAVAHAKDGTTQPGHIACLVTAVAPAAKATRDLPGDWLANATAENVRRTVRAMTAGSTIIADAVARGDAEVAGGIYELHTGRVSFL